MKFPKLKLSDYKAHSTLHGGCGMMLVLDTVDDAKILIREARNDGIKAEIVGETIENNKGVIEIISQFKEGKKIYSDIPE